MRVKAKVKLITRCKPLLMDDEISGTATMGNGQTMKAVLVRQSGLVEYQTPEGKPLNRMVKFFDYDPPFANHETICSESENLRNPNGGNDEVEEGSAYTS